jgi:hypothetical protein
MGRNDPPQYFRHFLGSVNSTIGMTGMFTINTISPTKKDCEAMPKTKGIRTPVMQTTMMRYFFRDMSGCFTFKDDAKIIFFDKWCNPFVFSPHNQLLNIFSLYLLTKKQLPKPNFYKPFENDHKKDKLTMSNFHPVANGLQNAF